MHDNKPQRSSPTPHMQILALRWKVSTRTHEIKGLSVCLVIMDKLESLNKHSKIQDRIYTKGQEPLQENRVGVMGSW